MRYLLAAIFVMLALAACGDDGPLGDDDGDDNDTELSCKDICTVTIGCSYPESDPDYNLYLRNCQDACEDNDGVENYKQNGVYDCVSTFADCEGFYECCD